MVGCLGSSILGVYPLDASSTPQSQLKQISADIAKHLVEGKIVPSLPHLPSPRITALWELMSRINADQRNPANNKTLELEGNFEIIKLVSLPLPVPPTPTPAHTTILYLRKL